MRGEGRVCVCVFVWFFKNVEFLGEPLKRNLAYEWKNPGNWFGARKVVSTTIKVVYEVGIIYFGKILLNIEATLYVYNTRYSNEVPGI